VSVVRGGDGAGARRNGCVEMKPLLNTQTVVDVIYSRIIDNIEDLREALAEGGCNAKTPKAAIRLRNENPWDDDLTAQFEQSCACIKAAFSILDGLNVPMVYRNETFEKKARDWSAIQ